MWRDTVHRITWRPYVSRCWEHGPCFSRDTDNAIPGGLIPLCFQTYRPHYSQYPYLSMLLLCRLWNHRSRQLFVGIQQTPWFLRFLCYSLVVISSDYTFTDKLRYLCCHFIEVVTGRTYLTLGRSRLESPKSAFEQAPEGSETSCTQWCLKSVMHYWASCLTRPIILLWCLCMNCRRVTCPGEGCAPPNASGSESLHRRPPRKSDSNNE